jgi:hypothetical protein
VEERIEVERFREVVRELDLVDGHDERLVLSVGRCFHFDEAVSAILLERPHVEAGAIATSLGDVFDLLGQLKLTGLLKPPPFDPDDKLFPV